MSRVIINIENGLKDALAMLKGDMVDILTRINDIEERLDELSLERHDSTHVCRLMVKRQSNYYCSQFIIIYCLIICF